MLMTRSPGYKQVPRISLKIKLKVGRIVMSICYADGMKAHSRTFDRNTSITPISVRERQN